MDINLKPLNQRNVNKSCIRVNIPLFSIHGRHFYEIELMYHISKFIFFIEWYRILRIVVLSLQYIFQTTRKHTETYIRIIMIIYHIMALMFLFLVSHPLSGGQLAKMFFLSIGDLVARVGHSQNFYQIPIVGFQFHLLPIPSSAWYLVGFVKFEKGWEIKRIKLCTRA